MIYHLQGYSPLMCACAENKSQIVKVLLEQGASVVYKGKVPFNIGLQFVIQFS